MILNKLFLGNSLVVSVFEYRDEAVSIFFELVLVEKNEPWILLCS